MSELYKILMGKYDEDVSNFLKNIETIYQQEKKL
jgi:predicted transcriptional regulator